MNNKKKKMLNQLAIQKMQTLASWNLTAFQHKQTILHPKSLQCS